MPLAPPSPLQGLFNAPSLLVAAANAAAAAQLAAAIASSKSGSTTSSASPSLSLSQSGSPSQSPSQTGSASASPSPSQTQSATATPSQAASSATQTGSGSQSQTGSQAASASATQSQSGSAGGRRLLETAGSSAVGVGFGWGGALSVDASHVAQSGWADPALVAGVAAVMQAAHEGLAAARRAFGESGGGSSTLGVLDSLRALRPAQLAALATSGGASGSGRGERRLVTQGPTLAAIASPVTCLVLGQTVFWELQLPGGAYPVYVKDSLLNTNPAFDYGAFRALASIAASPTSNVTLFAFTFSQVRRGGVE